MKTIQNVMRRLDSDPDAVVVRACAACAVLLPLLLWW